MAWPLDLPVIAAALRAAADQVAPSDAMEPRNHIPMALECQRIRADLLAIAAELEAHQLALTSPSWYQLSTLPTK